MHLISQQAFEELWWADFKGKVFWKAFPMSMSFSIFITFPGTRFRVSVPMLKSLIYLELSFIYGSGFILWHAAIQLTSYPVSQQHLLKRLSVLQCVFGVFYSVQIVNRYMDLFMCLQLWSIDQCGCVILITMKLRIIA